MKSKLLILLSVIFLFSCSKKDDNSTSGSKKPLVKTFSEENIILGSFWYDSQGRVTCCRLFESPDIDSTVYLYGTDNLVRTTYINGKLQEIEHGSLENGKVVSSKGNKADSSSFWSHYYTYDENGYLIREIELNKDSVERWREDYQIKDGNYISMTHRDNNTQSVFTYEYYPGTSNSLKSMGSLVLSKFYESTNLVKKVEFSFDSIQPVTEEFSYTRYDNGWVKTMTETSGSHTSTVTFTYW
ncbi:MAG: hypothetical protein Q8867_09880 [Bacteroidota bacterium]|nr:hypothetical protein [Bacteroidota bacterium]